MEFYVVLADAQRVLGHCDDAIAAYEEALRRNPGATRVLEKMVLCLTALGRNAQAESLLRGALGKSLDNPKLLTQLALALQAQGKSAEASAALEKATTLDPDLLEAWNDLGQVSAQRGNAAGAEAAFRSALGLQPSSPVVNRPIAWCRSELFDRRSPELLSGVNQVNGEFATSDRLSR